MDLNKDVTKIISFSFVEWLKDKKMQKYLFVLIIIYLLIMFVSIFSSIQFFSGISENISPIEIFSLVIGYTIFFMLLITPLFLIMAAINYFIIARGLELSKKKSINLSFVRYIKYLFYSLISMIVAMLSLYNIKFLVIGIVGLLFLIISFLLVPIIGMGAIALSMISFLLFLVYGIIVIYNSFRLIVGEIIFIEKEESIFKSLRASWDTTQNEVFNIVAIILVFVIIAMVVSFVSQIPITIYSMWLSLTMSLGGQVVNDISMMADPILIILMIPTYIISSYLIVAGNLMVVGIYNSLKTKK